MEAEVFTTPIEWDWYDLWWGWHWDGEREGNQEWTSLMTVTARDEQHRIDELIAMRDDARERMAARAAELDHIRITARWGQILQSTVLQIRELSRQTGVPRYVDQLGNDVDQFGQVIEKN